MDNTSTPSYAPAAKPVFGWAIIGTGRIAGTVAKEITASGRHKIVAVASRTKSTAEEFASEYGAKVYASNREAVLADGVDGVYIATPHSAHYAIAMECIKYGKPIICEKAFTVNAKQAKAVLKAAEDAGVYITEAMWSRFNPVVRQVLAWVKSGEIGDVKSISANFCLPLKITKSFVGKRVYDPNYAGGALLDLGVYPIAYAHMLLGFPQKIESKTRLAGGVDYNDKITLTYKNAVCKLNCSFDKLKTYKGTIIGTKGKIVSPMFYKPSSATLINADGKKTVRCQRGYIYEFDGVAADVAAKKIQNDYIPHKDTIEIMQIMDEIRRIAGLKYPRNIEIL